MSFHLQIKEALLKLERIAENIEIYGESEGGTLPENTRLQRKLLANLNDVIEKFDDL